MFRKGVKLVTVLWAGHPCWTRALRYGVAAAIEHMPVLRRLDCETVVDIGANRGQFALAARACFRNARIFSFEPLPEPGRVFSKVFAGDKLTMLYPVAVGAELAEKEMHVSGNDDSSSLLPITSEQEMLFPGTAQTAVATVNVGPLAAWLPSQPIRRALCKLDVQGYELQALQGCEDMLDCFDYIYVECSFMELYEGQALAHQVMRWLQQREFLLTGVFNISYDKQANPIQADLLFARKKCASS